MHYDGPALVVRGQPVTEEQAAEILIRTQSFDLDTSHVATQRAMCRLLGVRWDTLLKEIDPEDRLGLIDTYQCLPLYFLRNRRICSTSTFGPHGWCSWTGRIAADYNLVSWPNDGELETEWRKIAAAWPFLNLHAQVFNVSLEDRLRSHAKVLVEYQVQDGQLRSFTEKIRPFSPEEHPIDHLQRTILAIGTIPAEYRELGVSLPRLFTALQTTRHRLGLSPLTKNRLKEIEDAC